MIDAAFTELYLGGTSGYGRYSVGSDAKVSLGYMNSITANKVTDIDLFHADSSTKTLLTDVVDVGTNVEIVAPRIFYRTIPLLDSIVVLGGRRLHLARLTGGIAMSYQMYRDEELVYWSADIISTPSVTVVIFERYLLAVNMSWEKMWDATKKINHVYKRHNCDCVIFDDASVGEDEKNIEYIVDLRGGSAIAHTLS